MPLYKQPKSSIWHVRIYHQGQCVRESTGTEDKDEAQRFHDELKAKLWSTPRRTGKWWTDALVKWLEAEPRSESDRYSIDKLTRTERGGLGYTDRPLEECTVESFQEVLKALAPGTYNRYRAIIVAALNLSGVSVKFPVKKGKGKKAKQAGRIRYLTSAEWEKLYATLPKHLKPMAHLAVKTGLRQRNITHLQWAWIDADRRVLVVPAHETKEHNTIRVDLDDEMLAILEAQRGLHATFVFPYRGHPLEDVPRAWHLAMERAGLGHYERWETPDGKKHVRWVGDFTWHGLRHTWASWHVMNGTPLKVLMELGGWKDMRMVEHYSHLAPSYVAQYASNAKPFKAAA